jgi:hypothetical protein
MNTITDSNANAKGNLEAECQSNLLCSDRLSSGVFSLFDFTLCTCILLLLRALSKVLLNRSRYWPLCYTRIQSLDLPQANGPPEVLLSGSANHMNHVSA